MIRRALYPFLALCAAGLLFSTIIHTTLLLRNNYVPGRTIMNIMVVGIVFVWISAYLAITRTLKMQFEWGRYGDWRTILRSAPKWMMVLLYIIAAYTAVNFIILVMGLTDGSATYRLMSALWMLMYCFATAATYAALRVNEAKNHDYTSTGT